MLCLRYTCSSAQGKTAAMPQEKQQPPYPPASLGSCPPARQCLSSSRLLLADIFGSFCPDHTHVLVLLSERYEVFYLNKGPLVPPCNSTLHSRVKSPTSGSFPWPHAAILFFSGLPGPVWSTAAVFLGLRHPKLPWIVCKQTSLLDCGIFPVDVV